MQEQLPRTRSFTFHFLRDLRVFVVNFQNICHFRLVLLNRFNDNGRPLASTANV